MGNNLIKIKDIFEKYSDYLVNENELKKILVEPKPKSIFELKERDKYAYIGDDGRIRYITWTDCDIDLERLKIGNVFLTKEDAEFELEKRKIESKMLEMGGTRDALSLNNSDYNKYYIEYDYYNTRIYVYYRQSPKNMNCIYFRYEHQVKQVIEEIGEQKLIKYLFNPQFKLDE